MAALQLSDLTEKYGLAEGAKAYLEVQCYGTYTLPDGVVITCAFPEHTDGLAKCFEENTDGRS